MGKKRHVENDQVYIVRNADGTLDTDRIADSVMSGKVMAGYGEDLVTIVPNDWVGVTPELNVYGIGYNTLKHDAELFSALVDKSGITCVWYAKKLGITPTAFSYYRMGIRRVPYVVKNFVREMALQLGFIADNWLSENGYRAD